MDYRTSRRQFLCQVLAASAIAWKGGRPQWQVGICGAAEDHETFTTAGYRFLEPPVQSFLMPQESEDMFNVVAESNYSLPIPVANQFLPSDLKVVGPELDLPRVLDYAEVAFMRARRVGIEHIVFGSGGARYVPDGYGIQKAAIQFVEVLRNMAPLAEKWGIELCLEPLRRQETNFINTVPEAVDILVEVGHPSLGLTLDIYHILQEGRDAGDVAIGGQYIRHVHIAENVDRAPPGTHGEDFGSYFMALNEIGYTGRVSVECRWRDRERELASAYMAVNEQLQRIH